MSELSTMADAAVDPPPPRQNNPNNAGAAMPPTPPTPSLVTRFRSVLLTLLSMVLTATVVGNAFFQRQQFYPSVVYITKSNPR